jgi:serine protease Do
VHIIRTRTAFLRSRAAAGALFAALTVTGLAAMPAAPALAQDAAAMRAPVSFADVVDKVKGSVVSIYVSGGKPMAELGGGDGGPLDEFFKRFGEGGGGDGQGIPEGPGGDTLRELLKRFGKGMQPPGGGGGEAPRPRAMAQGSGFVISADGYVVTNNHVVEDAAKVEVSFDGDERLEADVIGKDARTDLALLKIKPVAGRTFPAVPLAKTRPRVGDWVVAVGNPFGLGGTVTAGIVSAYGREVGASPYDYMQIDAAINRGNSGGPSFNLDGEVVGVNSAIFSPSGGNVGIAFAVPSEVVEQVTAQLKTTGSVSRGWLGVHISNVSDDVGESIGMKDAKGALITKISEGGPSAGTELKAGDAVVAVNAEAIGNSRDLARKVAEYTPGTEVTLTVVRDGKEVPVKIKLGKFPSEQQTASLETPKVPAAPSSTELTGLGLSLAPTKDGVVVTGVKTNSEAEEKGLAQGDIILEVGGKAVTTPEDVKAGIDAAKGNNRNAVLVRVKSGSEDKFVALVIEPKG